MSNSTRTLQVAAAAYGRFENDEIKECFFRLLAEVDADLDAASYEESSIVEDRTQMLIDAMNVADEEEQEEAELEEDEGTEQSES
jgi:hypothetical protein